MDKVGVAPVVYKSGKFKDMLSPYRETNEIPAEEHEMVQSLINDTYQKFKGVVADGRDTAHDLNKKRVMPWRITGRITRMAACFPANRRWTWAWWMNWAILTTPLIARKRSWGLAMPI